MNINKSLIGLAVGLFIASLIAVGIWQTIVIIFLSGIGYGIGKYLDGDLELDGFLDQIKEIKSSGKKKKKKKQ